MSSFSHYAVATLGVPRIGPRRELKFALEDFWAGKSDAASLLATADHLSTDNWTRQKAAGVDILPSNDFSFYDHVLDMSMVLGAVPSLYRELDGLEAYFAMARGTRGRKGGDLPALEMTKWFDTNYHYMVPEFSRGQNFSLADDKPVRAFLAAKAQGHHTRPVLLGPVSFLLLGKAKDEVAPLSLLPGLLPAYADLLRALKNAGADWVQIDEPCLVTDLSDVAKASLRLAYETLAVAVPSLKLMLTTYFGGLGDNLDTALALPVAGLHLDLVRAPEQISSIIEKAPRSLTLSLGVVDGSNVWRADLEKILARIEPVAKIWGGEKLQLAPSCSLLHVPVDLALEQGIAEDVRAWLAFAQQKMAELVVLKTALSNGREAIAGELAASTNAATARASSLKVHNPAVTSRLAAVTPGMAARHSSYPERRKVQENVLKLPLYPTTTIGSFPQTSDVRLARAQFNKGALSAEAYGYFLRKETENAVRWQEEVGLDMLVHGEFERNDMVQYFGEQLDGFVFTKHGWVQSYGSRCVRPPIIFGDVSRPKPMTVEWARYAQSLTDKPMKGMLTGPVTILQWSFVRDDRSRRDVCRQIALALRDEVTDLELAGIKAIQIDEPAIREGLPLRKDERAAYLAWAVEAFRLAASGVADATQIHTHMCYSEFNDIIAAIAAMDADVISIETARSKMELLEAFARDHYPNEIGPGVYDIHSPRTPSVEEMVALLKKAGETLPAERIWVNPDCGLKTRKWDEVKPALIAMVDAARQMRSR
jgi:5-methyltetrahydropteroyltriglutamate--homocysteine methyltransferase